MKSSFEDDPPSLLKDRVDYFFSEEGIYERGENRNFHKEGKQCEQGKYDY